MLSSSRADPDGVGQSKWLGLCSPSFNTISHLSYDVCLYHEKSATIQDLLEGTETFVISNIALMDRLKIWFIEPGYLPEPEVSGGNKEVE